MKAIVIDQSPILDIAVSYDAATKEIQNVIVENHHRQNSLGNIYFGKVVQFSDEIEGAFVDIGTSMNGFLPKKEILRRIPKEQKNLPLNKLISKNQLISVQVSKEAYQTKGPQLTTDISLAGKYVVLLPYSRGVKYSKKITENIPKSEIETQISSIDQDDCGWIVRSIVNEISDVVLIKRDVERMHALWKRLEKIGHLSSKVLKVYEANGFVENLYRQLYGIDVTSVQYTNADLKQELLDIGFTKSSIQYIKSKNALYKEIGLNVRAFLFETVFKTKAGFTFTLDELEAFTIIDVNSAQYRALSKVEMTREVNQQSAIAIKAKLIARDISGVILIDFIDMLGKEEALFLKTLSDHIFTKEDDFHILGITKLGLLEMTRKRVKPSLLDALSIDFREKDLLYWTINELYFELLRLSEHTSTKQVTLEVVPELYLILAQKPLFNEIPLKVKLIKNNQKKSSYKISTICE
ncbi:ribonuclease E/G [Fusibacter sp. 3D3]|uniref:ribonuclease E/G n=1 Tax=Fusibacter sp. 3D3 TaxID=1048380 RepID=UPI00085296AB|nr:ribonuclease E/G [Fusibacter sp. 3D3]GAU77427.1 cytoplasmic axial filament protein CafA and Ribonuclease G [Fusibacter sp. 3D3]